jgi:hypothetical protein
VRRPSAADVRRFARSLRAPARLSTVRGALDGARVTWVLKRHGLRSLLDAGGGGRADPNEAKLVAAAVDAGMGVLPLGATCLRRTMTLTRELRRRGLTSTVRIGVRTVDGAVEAHAWVEVDGVVVNDDPALTETYTELAGGELERLLPLIR